MRRRTLLGAAWCFLLALIVSALVPDQALAAEEEIREAKVVRAGDGVLEIVEKDGDNVTLKVPASAKVTRNEKKASLEDLKQGDIVDIKASRQGDKLIALTIDAIAPE
jgi:Cu/Ag efflux protein CusF